MTEKLPEISRSASKHISRDLKPEVRKASTEQGAWEATQQILQMRIEGYPESFSHSYSVIREYHQIRWEMRVRYGTGQQMTNKELATRLSVLMNKYPEEALDSAKDIFAIITQIYSK